MAKVQRTRVKICGIRSLPEASTAVHLGADILGFNFFDQSARFISGENAAEIVAELPPFVSHVGLFVNASSEFVRSVLKICPLDLLQFHGDEDENYCRQFDVPYVKAIRHQNSETTARIAAEYGMASAILLDAYVPSQYGGTGEQFDWATIPALEKPLMVAGGLNAENVHSVIESVGPFAVDVCGGVESAPGVKSSEKMDAFLRAVGEADRLRATCHK
ncbi:MAG: phosphoribosylanthranilate isomerase [Pseudomonadales bacterium]